MKLTFPEFEQKMREIEAEYAQNIVGQLCDAVYSYEILRKESFDACK